MSDASLDLNMRDVLARIDRQLAESQKFHVEQIKLNAEARKLDAEARKLDRERWFAPALAIASVTGGLLGAATFIAKVIWP
jgi:hypothetical protein